MRCDPPGQRYQFARQRGNAETAPLREPDHYKYETEAEALIGPDRPWRVTHR